MGKSRPTRSRTNPMKRSSVEKQESSNKKRDKIHGDGNQNPDKKNIDKIPKTRNLSEIEALKIIEEIFKDKNIEVLDPDDTLSKVKEADWFSYSQIYLYGTFDQKTAKSRAEVSVFEQILEIDRKLGVTEAQLIYGCVQFCTETKYLDLYILKTWILTLKVWKMFQYMK